MDLAFVVVNLDLDTGRRTELPWCFDTSEAAAQKVESLIERDPEGVYIIKTEPLYLVSC